MNNKLDTNNNPGTKSEMHCDEYTDSEQTKKEPRLFSGRLATWLRARLNGHNDRVSALGVYGNSRLDGQQPSTSKSTHPAPK